MLIPSLKSYLHTHLPYPPLPYPSPHTHLKEVCSFIFAVYLPRPLVTTGDLRAATSVKNCFSTWTVSGLRATWGLCSLSDHRSARCQSQKQHESYTVPVQPDAMKGKFEHPCLLFTHFLVCVSTGMLYDAKIKNYA